MLTKFKHYNSHADVQMGDIIRFRCLTIPENSQYKMRKGTTQDWLVKKHLTNGIEIIKNSNRISTMILHDYKVNQGKLTINNKDENQILFDVTFSKKITFKEYINDVLISFKSIFKRKK